MTWLAYDEGLIENIAARLDLRDPNRDALSAVIRQIGTGGFREVVCDLATGVGKTYVMAALVDYLAAAGVRNVLIVTPGKTIQDKTTANFSPGSRKYVPGLDCLPHLVTAETYRSASLGDDLQDPQVLKLFVFNVQQMIAPSAGASRRMRNLDELIGTDLYGYLQAAEDLVVIADEHHVYRAQARRFSAAVRGLQPRALVGLTATPDPGDEDKVIYRYTLGHAIADGLVKVPVIVYRKDGHDDPRTQLADACHLLRVKAASYAATSPPGGQEPVKPVLFVVCQTVQEAEDAAAVLASPGMIGEAAVLVITSQSSDEALASLAAVEDPDSPVRAVVSVDKLKEGWDVKNIGVIVALARAGVADPYRADPGTRPAPPLRHADRRTLIDQVDIVAHDSYRRLLAQKDSLIQRVIPGRPRSAGSPAQSVPAGGQPGDEQFSVTGQATQGTFRLITHVRQPDGGPAREATSLVIQDFEDAIGPGRRRLPAACGSPAGARRAADQVPAPCAEGDPGSILAVGHQRCRSAGRRGRLRRRDRSASRPRGPQRAPHAQGPHERQPGSPAVGAGHPATAAGQRGPARPAAPRLQAGPGAANGAGTERGHPDRGGLPRGRRGGDGQ